ncbi:hypothetical protein KOR42_23470 [Thalassoglobus neptunius]|uniref:Uncharacterized protein n=1 Tax=Thalassoglobus neptunius TaxID=1938619 RepID=A0A5C5X7M6_9PLAN|nr:hypothetical protein KOR42_23470 [Thalassoglobus neptunius]
MARKTCELVQANCFLCERSWFCLLFVNWFLETFTVSCMSCGCVVDTGTIDEIEDLTSQWEQD